MTFVSASEIVFKALEIVIDYSMAFKEVTDSLFNIFFKNFSHHIRDMSVVVNIFRVISFEKWNDCGTFEIIRKYYSRFNTKIQNIL